jgi:DNA replication protein DnaC
MTEHQQLITNLQSLKLNEMSSKILDTIDFVNQNNLTFTQGLIKLTNYEIDHKTAAAVKAMVKVGAFPHHKEIEDFEFDFQENINRDQIMEFLSLGFLERGKNIVFMGSSGVGKTHLSTSIGIAAAKKRFSTYFIKCHDLITQLKRAKNENRLEDRLKHFTKYRLLIIDEIGYLPIDKEDSKLFFQLIDKRYEKRSTIFTTNINFSSWDSVFLDPVIANAILDRVLHHADVVQITGQSYRLKDHIKKED